MKGYLFFSPMNIVITAKVRGGYKSVYELMDRELFEFLAPPGPMELREYTGSRKGDVVHIHFGFPLNSDWISDIVEENESENELNFVDVGRVLPFPLKTWRHVHRIQKIDKSHARIVDDMHFSTGNKIFDGLVYPFLYLTFLPRKWQYPKYFKRKFEKRS